MQGCGPADKSKETSSTGPFSPSMASGSELCWKGPLQSAETIRTKDRPFWISQRPFTPDRAQAWGQGFLMGTSQLPTLAAPQQIEKGDSPPPNTYLREADGEESAWDAFTSPSGGAQQEPTEPAAPKLDFHTSSHPRMPYPSSRRKQGIKEVWLWCARMILEGPKMSSHTSALFWNFYRGSQVGKLFRH